mgnify:CR=1 FL=1
MEPGHRRLGLQSLQKHAAKTLHPSKWPFTIVYMNDVPKGPTGKLMRVNLAKRMQVLSNYRNATCILILTSRQHELCVFISRAS